MVATKRTKRSTRQKFISDGDQSMEPERIESLDEVVCAFCDAKDEIASQKEAKDAASEAIQGLMEEQGISVYLCNRGDTVFRVESSSKRKLSVKRVKASRDEE